MSTYETQEPVNAIFNLQRFLYHKFLTMSALDSSDWTVVGTRPIESENEQLSLEDHRYMPVSLISLAVFPEVSV